MWNSGSIRFLRRVRQRTRDRDRRMAAPPAGGTGSAKEPDRHGSPDLANAPSFPRAGDENTRGVRSPLSDLSKCLKNLKNFQSFRKSVVGGLILRRRGDIGCLLHCAT